MSLQDHIARIERAQEETRKFAAGTREINRDWALAPWQIAILGMTTGAALFGAGATFAKFFGA